MNRVWQRFLPGILTFIFILVYGVHASAPNSESLNIVPFSKLPQLPVLVSAQLPDYPWLAASAGMEGLTLCEVRIDSTGRVIASRILQSSGHKKLDEAALAAVDKFSFLPAQYGQGSDGITLVIPFEFKLRED